MLQNYKSMGYCILSRSIAFIFFMFLHQIPASFTAVALLTTGLTSRPAALEKIQKYSQILYLTDTEIWQFLHRLFYNEVPMSYASTMENNYSILSW